MRGTFVADFAFARDPNIGEGVTGGACLVGGIAGGLGFDALGAWGGRAYWNGNL